MSACAASIIVVTCEGAERASLLSRQWPSLSLWCGLAATHGPREIHHGKVLLALTQGGQLESDNVPCWVVEIGIFQHVADFAAARRRLWPKSQHNGHGSMELDFKILFTRKEQ